MLKNDAVNRYLIGVYKALSVSVGEAYASGVFHAHSFLGNHSSWYDVRNKTSQVADEYFDTIMQTGKGYGNLDVSDMYARINSELERMQDEDAKQTWYFLQDIAGYFRDVTERQSILAYRKGMMNTYIENGVEHIRLKCSNEWCQSYKEHADTIFKIGTEPDLPIGYCTGDYRPYKPQYADMLFADKVEGFTKKESDIMAEADEQVQKILDEAEQAVLRIMKYK